MAQDGNMSSRRSFLKAGAGLVGTMALASDDSFALGVADPPARRPNFIFVTTDGHRPDALSLNGNRVLQTPNFDRIGRKGIQFRNSFVVNALCLPARATALTACIPTTQAAWITRIARFRKKLRCSPTFCEKRDTKWRSSARPTSRDSANGIVITTWVIPAQLRLEILLF
jgi:Sulfatase